MTLESSLTVDTTGWNVRGEKVHRSDQTIAQIIGRATDLAFLTVMFQRASSLKWGPLDDVNPALTAAKMVCGAIGGAAPDFQAITDGEFAITVDGQALDITGLDFSGLDTEQDAAGYFTCGANGTNLAGWQAVTDGAFDVTVNGIEINITGLDFSTAATLNDVADTINYAANGRFTVIYDGKADIYKFVSNKTGETSTVAAPNAPAAGTDISAAGYLNAPGGSATAGVGGEGLYESISEIINAEAAGRFVCYFDGDAFVFVSPNLGLPKSTITVLSAVSGGAGTDISGASYLNGLTAVGTVTAATGEESTAIPAGIYWGNDILAATIAAGDVTGQNILVGKTVELDESAIVLEGSLTLDDIVSATGRTIRKHLSDLGIFARSTEYFQNIQPIA